MQQLYSSLPEKPGVYIFKDESDNILYVGKAKSLKTRVSSYFGSKKNLGPKTIALVERIRKIDHIIVENELEALILEANLIKKHLPQYNVDWKDGKAYPFIKITSNDRYPAVLQSRKIDDPKSIYFGPYPNIGDVRRILKLVRRIFPYVSVANHPKRICLYHHLGLCPCPIMFDSPLTKRRYNKTIQYIEEFLSGGKEEVKKELEKEMNESAKVEDFENASKAKKQLEIIDLITRPMHSPRDYISNPNLASEEAELSTQRLKEVLNEYGLETNELRRIECYDISNIQGKQAVGSMVVTTDGEIDKSQYRRFKIIFKKTPDDFAMHNEVMTRRLKHLEDWGEPDLLVIDGGAGQVHAAKLALDEKGISIPIIGLAKRLEEIYIPKTKELTKEAQAKTLNRKYEDFVVVQLPLSDKASLLLQKLRNEAHRFAITYHRKLRSKNFIK